MAKWRMSVVFEFEGNVAEAMELTNALRAQVDNGAIQDLVEEDYADRTDRGIDFDYVRVEGPESARSF